MKLTVVGCSGSGSGPESPASSYLVQADHEGRTFSLLLDLGPGSFGALYRYVDPADVEAVLLSHLHPDHCLDLCALYVGASYSPTAPWRPAAVYGPADTAERLVRAYDVAVPPGTEPAEPGRGIADYFDYRTWQPSQQIGPFDVTVTRVAHPVEAYGIRLTERAGSGASLVFSGDTGPSPALTELASGADLLLIEASFLDRPDNPAGLHLSGRQAAELGSAAGVGAVVLTHIPPWHDPDRVLAEATPHFAGSVELARSGARWTIG
ncbi:MBL fold metallo-hydrolase [Microlunatus parietis]|uniref:Ribonuclease BN (tRNA processing enzyme) n=1 Tax=Microlunatus parietis TaxID=682979 RepID=A0A7Y9LEA6_9ACTN|nr:MBL fold metallo-hydrolase [Microlunatus parietis]NYE73633.1 ribonuclease BN (tRNA processing enzyme) [Microlunatus parietis]